MSDIRTDRALELYALARGWVARGYLAPAEELRDLLDAMHHDVCEICFAAEGTHGLERCECAGCLDKRQETELGPCVRCDEPRDGVDPYCVKCGLEMSTELEGEMRHAV